MISARALLIWGALAAAIAIPLAASVASPLLAYRDAVYITSGLAGIIALALLLVQPLVIGGYLPGLTAYRSRLVHRWVGGLLVAMLVAHVGGLWITSPPDVIDALLFASPTQFSAWGVIAMWAVFLAAFMVAFRRRIPLRPRTWRICHTLLAAVIVNGSVIHGILIEGTMETFSKAALCAVVLVATTKVIAERRVWARWMTSREN